MRKTLPLVLMAAMVLASCGRLADTRLNPFNWFGRAESRALNAGDRNPLIPRRSALAAAAPVDNRGAIGTITGLSVERLPNGAIVRATAVADMQGAHSIALRRIEGDDIPDDMARYAFVGVQPRGPQGTQASRTVTAATRLTDQDLLLVRRIEVVGANNAMVTRR
ncbi:hypothetical protein [Pseudooceanicola sp. MF1-13]|uniref:hypothetical protein n=1 Tax=Pseudooceanicola sp. MF1-13 TaxID=3379095 RepID=UPI0038914D39